MSTLVHYGDPLTSMVVQHRQLKLTSVGESTFVIDGTITASLISNFIPQYSSASNAAYWFSGSDDYVSGLGLREYTADTSKGSVAKVKFTYSSIRPATLPADTLNEQNSSADEPIRNHPNFPFSGAIWQSVTASLSGSVYTYPMYIGTTPSSSADTFIGFPSGSIIPQGTVSFYVPTTTVTYTQYYLSDPGSPMDTIGQVTEPPGYSGMNNWLIIDATKQQSDVYYAIQTIFSYSALGWPTAIYPVPVT